MVRFTEEQKRIAAALFNSPKSVEDLNRQLNIPYDRLNDLLKQMLRLELVKVEGYPQKYKLADSVAEGVRKRKEIHEKDPFELRLKAVVEFKAVEPVLLEKQIREVEAKLRRDKNYTVYDIYMAKPQQVGAHYSSYLEVNISARDFASIVRFMYFFGPSSVEVLKPDKVVLSLDDLQEALMEMADMIQSYNASMLKAMSKDELEKFARGIYAPQKD